MEKLTRSLIESHLMSFVDICSESQENGSKKWGWNLSQMADIQKQSEAREFSFKYRSHESARNSAFTWIRDNRPDLEKAAVAEARAGIQYRARKS